MFIDVSEECNMSIFKEVAKNFGKNRPSDRSLSAKLVPTFADTGRRVVSATDPHGR
jgi:hypothetical protein